MKALSYSAVFLMGLFSFSIYSQAHEQPTEQLLAATGTESFPYYISSEIGFQSILFVQQEHSSAYSLNQQKFITEIEPPVAGYTTFFSTVQAAQVNSYTICEGGSVQLTAPAGGHRYLWTPSTGLSNNKIANPMASPTQTTIYTAKVFDTNWNTTEYTYIVNVNPRPKAYAGEDVSICAGRSDSIQLNASGGVSYSWSPATGLSSTTIANPAARPSVTTTYTVTVTNISGCQETDQVTVYITPAILDVKVFLQGPFHRPTSLMFTHLQDQGLLPTQQPYGTYYYLPYTGTETLGSSLPAHSIVDWILVELRQTENSTSTVFRKAGLLRSDGHIVNADGSPFSLTGLSSLSDSYYIVLRHRNHVDIMSAIPVPIGGTNGPCQMAYDFTPAQNTSYWTFQLPQISLNFNPQEQGPLIFHPPFGMAAGDINGDGVVNATDRVATQADKGLLGYRATDLSLDGAVNATDRMLVRNNTFKATQIP